MRSTIVNGLWSAAIVLIVANAASAQQTVVQDVVVVGPDTHLGADAGNQVVNARSKDLRADWNAFLDERGLHEGQNEAQAPGQDPFQIFMGLSDVHLSPSDPAWLDERAQAYDQAMLQAKEKYASFLNSEVQAGRSLSIFQREGQGIPEIGDKVGQTLSLMDKMRTLADKNLDDQIKKFDPNWDGTGKTASQRQERIVMLRRRYEEQVQASARAFTTGAAPIYTAEGPTRNGYGVLVGIVISGNMRKIARAITDPTIKLPSDAPEAPITKQIADRSRVDPAFLTATEGVRIMTDEQGMRVLVCFAGVPDTGDSMTTEKGAELTCRARVAQFVAEQIASDDRRNGGMAYDKLAPEQTTSGPNARVNFDQQFQSVIKATTPTVSMAGLLQIGLYEMQHHYTHQAMTVAVYEWSQASSATATQLRQMNDQSQKDLSAAPASGTSSGVTSEGGPAAVPVNRGISTNPSKF